MLMVRVRHRRLEIADQQPLRPAPALPAPQPPPDRVEPHLAAQARDQRRLVQLDAPITRLAEGAEAEALVFSQGGRRGRIPARLTSRLSVADPAER